MELTEFQQYRIGAFFAAVQALEAHPEVRVDRQKAQQFLVGFFKKIDANPTIAATTGIPTEIANLFMFLEGVGIRQRRYNRLLAFVLMALFITVLLAFAKLGWVVGVGVLVAGLVLVVIWAFLMWRYYITRRFSPLSAGLTPTEVQFAINAIVLDPRWRKSS